MKIMKFGGTSVGSGSRMLHVGEIIKEHSQHESIIVVISAMCGVTDKLISIFHKYKLQRLVEAKEELSLLYLHHLEALKEMKINKGRKDAAEKAIDNLFGQLVTHLTFHKVFEIWDYDFVVSFGERLSVILISAALQKLEIKSKTVDSKDLIVTNDEFGDARALFPQSKEKIENILYPFIIDGIVPVVPGFYGATRGGKIATLGRGGSDYTATILAHALDAQEVVLWKEVDGVFTGDPKNGHKVEFIAELSYERAIKMAQNGAKVLHPEAIRPVADKEIVVWVKNTFNPDFAGTKIWKGV